MIQFGENIDTNILIGGGWGSKNGLGEEFTILGPIFLIQCIAMLIWLSQLCKFILKEKADFAIICSIGPSSQFLHFHFLLDDLNASLYPVLADTLLDQHGSVWPALPPPPPQEPGAGRGGEGGEHGAGVGPLHRLPLLLLPSRYRLCRHLLQLSAPLTCSEAWP